MNVFNLDHAVNIVSLSVSNVKLPYFLFHAIFFGDESFVHSFIYLSIQLLFIKLFVYISMSSCIFMYFYFGLQAHSIVFIMLSKLFQFWLVRELYNWLLYSFGMPILLVQFCFVLAFIYFLILQDATSSSCIFSAPVLEKPFLFLLRMMLKTKNQEQVS